MKLEQFVKQFCSPHIAITVCLLPQAGNFKIGAEVELGTGMGKYPEHLSRKVLKEHRKLAQAEIRGVIGGKGTAELWLAAQVKTEELVLLAGLIEAGQLPGKTWMMKEGEEK